ncbi:putative ribosomal protein S15 [Rosa chinensis]|uniref:Small ribosomal subunit protein uS15c n=1 Tax=Rosa chinensis TaxID=74649 RepID=A0A2P6RVL0_ROSCH|nr:37S ribosomal protein S28, mitochondrial [Rosa chinensis]PRQ50467.1 putative ribosomal protein S15 [Rosa chinensis]
MMALRLRTNHRTLTNPSLIHLFSTSSPDPSDSTDPTEPNPQSDSSSLSNYFSDVKASLRQQSQSQSQSQQLHFRPTSQNNNPSLSRPSKAASLEEIRKNLAEFRLRSIGPNPTESNSAPPPPPPPPNPISFEKLYNKGVSSRKMEFQTVRESLKLIRPNANEQNERKGRGLSLLRSKSLDMNPSQDVGVRKGALTSLFGKEKERSGEKSLDALKTEFVKIYSYKELGEKLRKLRPEEGKEGGGFTLGEFSERLVKLRKMEENESESWVGGLNTNLTQSLLKIAAEEKHRKTPMQRLHMIDIGQTPDYMMKPPKEGLVEKYFHPANMSSAEKLKIELGKVRDEFKMSESDCGSARVQVAQLTTKIKHLSSVLHKKDKHSLKGLQAMVQRRKKLLKYLRRTDWDSYCLVLSKLGLRDTPDAKQEYKKHYKN